MRKLVLILLLAGWSEALPEFLPVTKHVGDVRSTFKKGLDGWSSSDGEHALRHKNGALQVRDITEAWHWLIAPKSFHGDWRHVERIKLRVRVGTAVHHPMILELRGPLGTASYSMHTRFLRKGEWCDISVPIRESFWTAEDWVGVTGNVTSFRIRMDLHEATDAMEVHTLDEIAVVSKRVSTFEYGNDGWTCRGGSLRVRAGRLEVTDQGDGWCWLRAPVRFRGDVSGATAIEFHVRADQKCPIRFGPRVQIESKAGTAIYDLPVTATAAGEWKYVHISLDPKRWAVSGDFAAILRDVSDLWIRVDLTEGRRGGETNGIDNVTLATR